jgi:hypothetical protein
MNYTKLIFIVMIVCRSISFATEQDLKGSLSKRVGSFPKHETKEFIESLNSSTSTDDTEDDSPKGLLFVNFADEKTRSSFNKLLGDITFHIFPILGEDPDAYEGKEFYEGSLQGVPYDVTYPTKDLSPSLGKRLEISSHCSPLEDRSGHYCRWDRRQVIMLQAFSLSLFQEGVGEFPLISWTRDPRDMGTSIFPISSDHVNKGGEGKWSLINICLKHEGDCSIRGWSFTHSLINDSGIELFPKKIPDKAGSPFKELQKSILKNNSRRGPTYQQLATLDSKGYEISQDGKRIIQEHTVFIRPTKTADEDGAEDESGWRTAPCYNRYVDEVWIHIPV